MLGRIWQRSNWINDAVLPLLGALTWSAWGGVLLAGLLDFVTDHQANLNTGPVVWLLLLGGSLAARQAARRQRGVWIILLAGLAATLLAEWWLLFWPAYAPWDPGWVYALAAQVAVVAPGPFLVAIGAALAWRHGALAEWTSHAEMTSAFVSGVLVLGAALFAAAAFNPAAVGPLTVAVLILLVSAWAGLSLAGVADAAHSVQGDQPLQLSRFWLLASVTVVGVIFGLGLLLAAFVTPDSVRGWVALFEPVLNVVRLGLWYLFYGATYLIFLVLTPLIDWLHSLMSQGPQQPARPFNPFANRPPNPAEAAVVLPPALELLLRALTIAGFLVLIGLLITWALRRKAATDPLGVRENRDLIWSWDLLQEQLAGLLARRGPPPAFAELAGEADDPLTWVRRAYQRLLALAQARGRARPPRQTPQAYLPTLTDLWPGETRSLAELTAAYTAARYGQVPPSAEQLAALKQAMDRLASDSA